MAQKANRDDIERAERMLERGDVPSARVVCRAVLQRDPRNPAALRMLADAALQQGDFQVAIHSLTRAVDVQPRDARPRLELGKAYLKLGRPDQAVNHLVQSVRLNPSSGEARTRLCGVLGELGYFEQAVREGEKAVELAPLDYVARTNLAFAYAARGQPARALEQFEEAARLAPGESRVQCSLGNAYVSAGSPDEAEACYRKAISLDPTLGTPYRQLSRMRTYVSTKDPEFERLRDLVKDPAVAEPEKSSMHFALGKMYDDCGCYDEAFLHYSAGNAIEDRRQEFDAEEFGQQVSQIARYFSADFFDRWKPQGNSSRTPVFVVGMPRSGTTLVERIIASHPRAFGAGELYWMDAAIRSLPRLLNSQAPYPHCFGALTEDLVSRLSEEYLAYLRSLPETGRYDRIVDKMPGNFMYLGLIGVLFPKARIIHCRRDPLDTCFSIYSTLFPGSVPFGYDLGNLGAAYVQYRRLMRHWETIIGDRILTLDYERLVSSPERVSRELIDFIRLPWHDRCLEFHKNDDHVGTVTAFQVRQPVYRSAVGRWRRYEAHLKGLKAALGSS